MLPGQTINLEQLPSADYNDESARPLDRFWAVVRFMAEGRFSMLHAFYHEEDKCVRVCAWPHVARARLCWVELAPLLPQGLEVLSAIRRRLWGRNDGGEKRRTFRILTRDEKKTVVVRSPHAWDVRVSDAGCQPAPNLPYVLVPRQLWESKVGFGAGRNVGGPL